MNLFKIIKTFSLLIFLLISYVGSVSAGNFVVIVNAENTISGNEEELKNEIKRLFLKAKKAWSDNIDAKPLSAKEDSEEYQAFVLTVLNMDSAGLAQHWLKAKQKTGDTPPRSVSSSRSVIKLVARSGGTFGFIPKADVKNLGDKVRVLFEF